MDTGKTILTFLAGAAAGMAKEKILEGLDDLEEALEEN